MDLTGCSVCGGVLETVVKLPSLPLTGIFRREGQVQGFPSHDQALMLCPACRHAQLARALSPDLLYGSDYGFRTSKSATASKGSAFFAQYLERLVPGKRFSRVLEFGCSDAVLLRLLRGRADRLLGVDPVLEGREHEFSEQDIAIAGARIEQVDVHQLLRGKPDLIVSQHTLEHIPDPKSVLLRLLDLADEETLFVLEFPCLDPLLEQLRFDQVFHQHVQYFSFDSFAELLRQVGAELVDFTFHYTYWGALLAAFRKSKRGRGTRDAIRRPSAPGKTAAEIAQRFARFRQQMELATSAIADCKSEELFGYGAALMLPILGYHLGSDFRNFQAILDDDPAKDGIGYANLPVRVRNPRDMDLQDLTVCLTAMDNRRPILRRLAEKNPKRIINPLCFI